MTSKLQNDLLKLVAKEHEHRARLAQLAQDKRQLVIKLHDKEGENLTFQQIADLLGITTRAGAERIAKGRGMKGA